MTLRIANLFLTAAAAALLTACGGGGGAGSFRPVQPIPTPTPTPTPTPAPTPTPTPTSLDTAEYRRSNAATAVGALTAYRAGALGAGIRVGVIDSGINPDSPEFAGRIDTASRGANGISVRDTDGHGTSVSGVIAAAANGSGSQGVAPQATIVAFRADDPGTCGEEDGCKYPDTNIAEGVDAARLAGAKVINISLGGSPALPVLRRAIDRATAADIIIVISSGNDSEDDPDPLALVANDPVARGRVLIAGALDDNGLPADFSNRAGSGRNHYFGTLGVRVLSFDQTGEQFLYSGTSYAAPGVAGALALLFSAFPNLTADDAIAILERSARDLGAAGVDAIYGHGALDIAAAFRAQGQTSLAGSRQPLSVGGDPLLTTGGAAGDGGGFGSALGAVVVLDEFGRAYGLDISDRVAARAALGKLIGPIMADHRSGRAAFGPAALSLSMVGGERNAFAGSLEARGLDARGGNGGTVRTGYVSGAVGKGMNAAFGYGLAPDALLATVFASQRQPSWLGADQRLGDDGIVSGSAAAVSHRLGRWTLGFAAGQGRSLAVGRDEDGGETARFALHAARTLGPVRFTLGYERLGEQDSFLGSRGSALLGLNGANSDFVSAGADVLLGGGWALGLDARGGLTGLGIDAGGVALSAERLKSSAFAVDLTRRGAFLAGDMLGLRISQPLRIEGGAVTLRLPTGYDYAARAPIYTLTATSLSPSGREVAVETAYERPLAGGYLQANAFWRHQPGHIAAAPDDAGVAVRLGTRF